MKLCSLSLSLSAALLLLMPGCANMKSATGQKKAPSINANTPGAVITTPSGLRYQVLANGPAGGRSPSATDSVTVHYRGTLLNGTVFDSSYDRGEPTSFRVNQVIPGWTEALQSMKPGDHWLLFVPAHLGYGSNSAGKIPPNSDLIFQVHLMQVNGRS